MGKADIVTKEYLKNTEVFADLFNLYLYQGDQIILPQNLQEIDTAMLAVPYGAEDAGVPVQRYRDGLKILAGMTDGSAAYCVLGAEGHLNVHYAVPVKNGVYDFLQLSGQVTQSARSHERQRQLEAQEKKAGKVPIDQDTAVYRPNGAEYLSGFWKTDRLLPVITVVVYWNAGEWDGPLTLREMYGTQDETILKYAPDYHVNLIAPYNMTDAEINRFHTDMREIMLYIKYSKDKDKLEGIMQKDSRFHKVKREAVEVINNVTRSNLKYPEGKEEIDMCQAIREMREESEKIGEERMKARAKRAEVEKEKAEARMKQAEALNREQAARIRELEELLARSNG